MKRLIIFISKFEDSLGSAKKIKEESEFCVEVIKIENFYIDNIYSEINKDDIIFFLCASNLISEIAIILDKKGCSIINRDYFVSNYTKKEIQIFLKNNNIRIPNIYTENICNNNKFPIFLKENKHTGISLQLYNRNSQEQILDKFSDKDFYLEDSINLNNSKEIKVYGVNGILYYQNNYEQKELKIIEICKKIIEIFNNIEVCSIDFIYNEKEYYLIDFNPSSGFYATDSGRKGFINYCKKIINR